MLCAFSTFLCRLKRTLPVDDLSQIVWGRNVTPCVGDIGDSPLESEFFDVDPQRGIQITLMAHEVVFIPFAFLSLEPRSRASPTSAANFPRKRSSARGATAASRAEPSLRGDNHGESGGGPGPAERSVVVAFVSASHGHVVSMMQVCPCSAFCSLVWSSMGECSGEIHGKRLPRAHYLRLYSAE